MGDDRPFPKKLDVRGEMDTANPIADRPAGTLVAAPDVDSKAWGPRRGSAAFAQVMRGGSAAALYDGITLNGTGSASARAVSYEDAFRDLGTKFTIDLWFRLEDLAYASAVNRISLYAFAPNAGYIDINIFGGAHSDHERIEVIVVTSPTRTTSASPVAITGATRLTAATTQVAKRHVRFVRDGANGYIYLDGVLDGSTSGISATNPINGAYGSFAAVILGGGTTTGNITFNGNIYGAVLRDGAFRTQPIEARMPCAPWARNVHHYHLNHNYALGGDDHYFDASRFGAHARIHGSGANYTKASGADDSAPAPTPVQGMRSWTTRTNRSATSVMVGGQLSTAIVS